MNYRHYYPAGVFPDYSNELVHLTKSIGSYPGCGFACGFNPPDNACDRLIQILNEHTIRASRTPQVQHIRPFPISVCFSECIQASIHIHAARYSPYGLVFEKPYVFNNGGGPVWYISVDIMNYLTRAPQQRQRWEADPEDQRPYIPQNYAAFFAPIAPEGTVVRMGNNRHFDWSFEREWRIPHDFNFDLHYIERLYVQTDEERQEFYERFDIPIDRIVVLVPVHPEP